MTKGHQKQDLLTGVMFTPERPEYGEKGEEEKICAETKRIIADAFIHQIQSDEELRKEVITAILQTKETAVMLAEAVFATRAKEVGLMTSGSIADLFRKTIRKSSKKKTKQNTE